MKKIPVHFTFTYTHYAWTEFSSNIFICLTMPFFYLSSYLIIRLDSYSLRMEYNFIILLGCVGDGCTKHLPFAYAHTLIKSDNDVKKIHSLYQPHIIFNKKTRSQKLLKFQTVDSQAISIIKMPCMWWVVVIVQSVR